MKKRRKKAKRASPSFMKIGMSKFTLITGKMSRGRVMKITVFRYDLVRMFISTMGKSLKITNKLMFPLNDHRYKRCRANLIDENLKVERSLL